MAMRRGTGSTPGEPIGPRRPGTAGPDRAWAALRDVGNAHRAFAGVLTDARLDGDRRVVTFANGVVAKELPRAFTFFNGGRSVYGWAGMGFALGANPSGLGTDLSRWETWEDVKYDFPGGNARPEAPL